MVPIMDEPQERQVSADSVIRRLRQRNEELSYQLVIAEAVNDELQAELLVTQQKMEDISPPEDSDVD